MGEFVLDKAKIDEYFKITSKSEKKSFIIKECLEKIDSSGKPVSRRKCATALGVSHSTLNLIFKDTDEHDDFTSPLKITKPTVQSNNDEKLIGIEARLLGLEDRIASSLRYTIEQETKIISIDKNLEILNEKISVLIDTALKNVDLKLADSQLNNNKYITPNNIQKQFLKLQRENEEEGSIPMTFRIIKSVHQKLQKFSDEHSLNKTSIITVLVDEYIKNFKEEEEDEQNK
jgi:hypothetical protein